MVSKFKQNKLVKVQFGNYIEDQVIEAKAKRNKFKYHVPSNRVSES